jgi:cytochrome P450
MVQQGLQAFRFCYVLWCYPLLNRLTGYLLDEKQITDWVNHDKWLHSQTFARVDRGQTGNNPDFLSFVVRIEKDEVDGKDGSGIGKKTGVTDDELHVDSGLFLTAGTDTTAHVLTTSIFLLCQNPDSMTKLKEEIRGLFERYEDITPEKVGNMPFLSAVLSEALRLQTPTAVGFGRRVGKGGEYISQHFIPEGTGVQVSQYSNNRSSRNFAEPDAFAPERWLGDERFDYDKRDSFQPFSVGPRNCIGKVSCLACMSCHIIPQQLDFS